MKNTIVIAAVILVLAAVSITVFRLFKQRNEEFGGFRDWVKNPSIKRASADYHDARRSLKIPDDLSEAEIQRMVDRLFVQEDEDFNFRRLKLVGAKAVQSLIEALQNPNTAIARFGDGGHALDAESPFERICDLLEPFGPAEAARPLSAYVDHDDTHFRKYAALALGNIGTPECVDAMLRALSDDDDYVRSYAMLGIQRGIEAKRCTRQFLNAMFPAITELLNRDDESVSGTAPELLLAIDTDRAMPVLFSTEYFTINNKMVHYIIRALNVSGHKVPHDILLPFINTVKPMISRYPHAYDYAEALVAYAHNPDASAEPTFRTELNSVNQKVQKAAGEALAILSGIANAREVVFEALENLGFDGLSIPQKHYYSVFIYDSEVTNGGHAQYFVNSSGEHWALALEGLEAIGANVRVKVLQQATNLFGANGPSEDNDVRHRQLARFSKRKDKSLEELDDSYFSSDENVDALLAQYTLQNKEHFSTQKQ